jgi:hypothetical protein
MQKLTRIKGRAFKFKTHIKRKLLREFRHKKRKTSFFTTICIEAGIFEIGAGREHLYDEIMDFCENAYSAFGCNEWDHSDDDEVMRIADDIRQAVYAVFVLYVPW